MSVRFAAEMLRSAYARLGWAVGALVLVGSLAASASGQTPRTPQAAGDTTALQDTPDSSRTDTLGTRRVERYLPDRLLHRPTEAASLQPHRSPLLSAPGSFWQHQTRLDSTAEAYVLYEQIGEETVRDPVRLDYDTYRRERLKTGLEDNWRTLATQRERQRQRERGRGGLGLNVSVPGGRQSAFSTIFGQPQVDLRVNGQAQINAGFDYRRSDQQANFYGRAGRLDPSFKQDLRLGITGTIGDKLQVNVDWDTNSQFDYQNQLKLDYTGYEDEIVQSVEAGNVLLETSSTLINSGQKLFGIKSQLQLGGINITTVASQEKGQSNTLSLEGGAQTQEFDLQPIDYDARRHFFLAYHFRNWWEEALSDPPTIRVFENFDRITDIEVWRLQRPDRTDEQRNVVAMIDLGEDEALVEAANAYTTPGLPSSDRDQYAESELENALRSGDAPGSYLESQKGLSSADYQRGQFVKLDPQRDYTLHGTMGYLSLRQALQENQALAVAFKYRTEDGQVHQVGDFVSDLGGSNNTATERALILKLIRPTLLRQPNPETGFNPAAWYLEMRNVYSLRGSNFSADNFELDLYYEPPGGTPQTTLPSVQGQRTLLQMLGLDRLNENGARQPDDRFDFVSGVTINTETGRLIFPYLEPFGQRMADLMQDVPEETRRQYILSSLYAEKKDNARDNSGLDIYRIQGSSRNAQPSFYDLGAYAGLVEGSVRVTAGGAPLQEGSEYVVDYNSGTVQITDPSYLTAGRQINISYEQNQMFSVQKKTLLGARADYNLGTKLDIGATVMSLSEQSPVDKFRIGEEPTSNLIVGLDGRLDLEPRWLTWAVDALPFVQTKALSAVSLTAEVAQLRPGHGETTAFDRSRDELLDRGLDFKNDERRGISYVDDFEGFENTYSLKHAGAWRLAAAPDSINRHPGDLQNALGDSLRTNWRASMGWYQLNQNMLSRLDDTPVSGPEASVLPIPVRHLFPNRTIDGARFLETFDVYFNPHERGPYNYTTDLGAFLNNPADSWGGIVTSLPEGYNDFELRNIEFVEFIFRPFPDNSQGDADRNAKLYVDLGTISEDVVPNERLNNEDGLSLSGFSEANIDNWSRLPGSTQNNSLDLNDETPRRTEDLGLDGFASYDRDAYQGSSWGITEFARFSDFLDALQGGGTTRRYQSEVAKALRDPSGDDYRHYEDEYFNNEDFYPGGATVQQRFTRFFAAQELNGYEPQSALRGGRGNSQYPDSEDLNGNSTIDTQNDYFQYELPLNRAALDSLANNDNPDDFVLSEIRTPNHGSWYLVRIPVRKPDRNVGNSRDFSLIESMRLWTTGHRSPVTLRFASMELVGSQWRKSSRVPLIDEDETQVGTPGDNTRLTISSINDEEHSNYSPPDGTVRKQVRTATGLGRQFAREQALVLNVENLMPGQQRAIYKTYNQGMDLLKYSNLRMFAHMNGQTETGTPLSTLPPKEAREKVELFIRLGANESEDYYEYAQPLSPSPPGSQNAADLWQTNQLWNGQSVDLNSVNIMLSALNQLKVARDDSQAPLDETFWHVQDGHNHVEGVDNFAPPGTRLGIKGTPSLGNIRSIVIGVRNASPRNSVDVADMMRRLEVWVNELRVSGYDQSNGWAALANADIQMADFGQIRGNFQRQVPGFGSLSSTLDDRKRTDMNDWSFTSSLNLDKFLPEQYGWRIPLSLHMKSRTSTPEFAPSRGDVRINEIVEQIRSNQSLPVEERDLLVQEAIRRAQTSSNDRSISLRLSKRNSDSWLMQKTLDGLTLRYSFSDQNRRTPSVVRDDSWRWNGALDYKFNTDPRTLNPFGFLDEVPLLGVLADLAWNYVPNAIGFGADATRQFSAMKDRPRLGASSDLPGSVQYRLRDRQRFDHRRSFNLQYNPFKFLNLGIDTSTDQNMDAASADTLSSVVVVDAGGRQRLLSGTTLRQAQADGLLGVDDEGYQIDSLRVLSTRGALERVLLGSGEMYPETYDQRFTATLQPTLSFAKWLDWIEPQDLTYRANYEWDNGPIGRPTGATAGNRSSFRAGVTLHPQDFWRKFDFYKDLEEEQAAAEEEAEREAAPADSAGTQVENSGFSLPLPSLRSIFRQTVLAVTGIENFNITYSGNRSSTSSYVGRPTYAGDTAVDVSSGYSFWDALYGDAPSLRYRLGLDRRIRNDFRIFDPTLNVDDELTNGNRLQARTTLSPTSSLQINLNWNTEWNDRTSIALVPDRLRPGSAFSVTESQTTGGSNRTSVWAFGASYRDLFERQLNAYLDDYQAGVDTLHDRNSDGRVALGDESVLDDFRKAFANGFGTVDRRGLLPLPMPGWTVTYSGLSDWTLFDKLTQRVTLRHVYNANYSTDFRTNQSVAGAENVFALGRRWMRFTPSPFRSNTAGINERFAPLVGLDIRWENGIQTSLSWNQTNAYTLNTGNKTVSENNSDELSFNASYQKRGLKLPLLPIGRLRNQVRFSLVASFSFHDHRRYILQEALSEVSHLDDPSSYDPDTALEGENKVTVLTGSRRFALTPKISYKFSNRVSADFLLNYEKLNSQDSRISSSTNLDGGFNVRVTISN